MKPTKLLKFINRDELTDKERELRVQKRCPYANKIQHKTRMYGTMYMYAPCRDCEICHSKRTIFQIFFLYLNKKFLNQLNNMFCQSLFVKAFFLILNQFL